MLLSRIRHRWMRLRIGLSGLDGTERFIPKLQRHVAWATMHFERYRFACSYVQPTDTVMDVACGVGYGTDMLSHKASSVYGYDLSASAVRYARKHYAGTFEQKDLFQILEGKDVVVSFETVEHIPAALEVTLSHLLSLAKHTFIASVPYMEKRGNNPFHHHFDLAEKDLDFLHKYGNVRFFYQEPEPGFRIEEKPGVKVQNLIIVVRKTLTPST